MNIDLKKKLEGAGRYEEIISILEKLINSNSSSFPVNLYIRDGKQYRDVNAEIIKAEASNLIKPMRDYGIHEYKQDDYRHLMKYFIYKTHAIMHNYTIVIAHRKNPEESDIENIRCHLILENFLMCMDIEREDGSEWKIPDGWKKISGNCQ